MRLRLIIVGGTILALAMTAAPAQAADPPTPPEPRDRSGIVLAGPANLSPIAVTEAVGHAYFAALNMARENPDSFGYPWVDRSTGKVGSGGGGSDNWGGVLDPCFEFYTDIWQAYYGLPGVLRTV